MIMFRTAHKARHSSKHFGLHAAVVTEWFLL